MTTGITAVGGAATSALPRRLAVVALVAITTFSVARFVDFSPSNTTAPTSTATPRPKTSQQQIAALEVSTRRDPTNATTWQQLGGAYLHRAIETADPAFYSLSGRALDRADSLVPNQAGTAVTRGVLLLSLHEFARAHDLVAPISASDPYNADALAVLVDADVELGHYDDAATVLQQLLDLRPGLPAYSRTSYLRELHGDLVGAEQSMRQALTAGAGDAFDVATVTTFLGDLAFGSGNLTEAGARYREALRLRPGHVNATLGNARVLAATGHAELAIHVLRALTQRVPLPAAVILLGDLQAAAGRTADAARSFELVRSIVKLQQAAGAVTDLETAVFEADHHSPDRALAAGRAAYAARPDNVYAADALAWALVNAGDGRAAQPYIAQALRLGSADASVHYHAAVIASAVGNAAEARRELQYVFARNPFFSFSQRGAAGELAARLGVATPSAWEQAK
ncbi:MAG: tetratricopeptide repeat protein [Acidimicrobiia bacterium]